MLFGPVPAQSTFTGGTGLQSQRTASVYTAVCACVYGQVGSQPVSSPVMFALRTSVLTCNKLYVRPSREAACPRTAFATTPTQGKAADKRASPVPPAGRGGGGNLGGLGAAQRAGRGDLAGDRQGPDPFRTEGHDGEVAPLVSAPPNKPLRHFSFS